MSYTTLISTDDLAARLDSAHWRIIDCRFNLAHTTQGEAAYAEAHIPGAIYAHLDRDLSGPIVPGVSGRHPLPGVEEFAARLSAWGIDDGIQVVAYDDSGGMFAARLWWMLRWLGHDNVAVLDGGWRHWQAEDLPQSAAPVSPVARHFTARPRDRLQVDADELMARLANPALHLFDARGADRFRGENETLDPVAGHIPGAVSVPFMGNLANDGRFLSQHDLRERYQPLLAGASADESIVYCGSGVTAAHLILAMQHAGLGEGRLYAGSWSHWITDPARPVVTGQ